MPIHFEELWEECEKIHQGQGEVSASTIISELMMKLNLYKAIDEKKDIPQEDSHKIKSRTLGEILLTITNLSLIDNIDVFESLNIARQFRTARQVVDLSNKV